VTPGKRRSQGGFTLLEILVASTIMGVAVVGMLSGISGSLRNAARLTDYDRIALVARAKMDALLVDHRLPKLIVVEGEFDPVLLGGAKGGWRARVSPFELPPAPSPRAQAIERIQLEIWWMAGEERRSFSLEAFRRVPMP
jgi:general secretion pathway protein I